MTNRVILFKMPTVISPNYTQKMMDILAAPNNLIIKFTTYRDKWVPTEVVNDPKSLKDKLAWIVCVGAKKATDGFTVEKFIPVREVKIVDVEKSLGSQGEGTLILWLEMHNYLSCDDYQKFRKELEAEAERKKKLLPPNEKSYILPDANINCVNAIDSNHEELEKTAWKALVGSISALEAFRNSVFYKVLGISEKNSFINTENKNENGEPSNYYKLAVTKTYVLVFYYYFPEKQYEFCPQIIKTVSKNEWVKFYDDAKMIDREGAIKVNLMPSQISNQYPYEHLTSIDLSVDSSPLVAPRITIPTLFVKGNILTKLKRNAGMIGSSAVFIALFSLGQLLPGIYPPVNGVSPTLSGIPVTIIGAALSTIAITLIPISLALWKKDE